MNYPKKYSIENLITYYIQYEKNIIILFYNIYVSSFVCGDILEL